MDLLFLGLIVRAGQFRRMLSLRAMCSNVLLVFMSFNLDTRLLLRGRVFRLGIGEKIGNVALVFFAVDWYDEVWRVVANFAYLLRDGIAFKFAFVRFQNGLQFLRPGLSGGIEPCSHLFASIVQNNRHAIMEELQIRVGGGCDHGVRVQLLLRAYRTLLASTRLDNIISRETAPEKQARHYNYWISPSYFTQSHSPAKHIRSPSLRRTKCGTFSLPPGPFFNHS